MARIKIQDLPKDMKVSEGEMKKVRGGSNLILSSYPQIISIIIPGPRPLSSRPPGP
jgi:hypothetical protein